MPWMHDFLFPWQHHRYLYHFRRTQFAHLVTHRWREKILIHAFRKDIIIIIAHYSFSHQRQLMVFHRRLCDSKSPQVSRTVLCILAVLNSAVAKMVSTRPPTSKSSRPFNNSLVTVPRAPITIGIIVTFMFHSFFQFSCKVEVLISLFTFFQFYSVVSQDSKFDTLQIFFFFFFFCWLL